MTNNKKGLPWRRRYGFDYGSHEGAVYVVELRNGVVKVGCTRNPLRRLETLAVEVKRLFGTQMSRFYISQDLLGSPRQTERVLLKRMRRIGNQRHEATEYFTDIKYSAARLLCEQMVRKELAALKTLARPTPRRKPGRAGPSFSAAV